MKNILKYSLVILITIISTTTSIFGQENDINNIHKSLYRNNKIKSIRIKDFKLENNKQTGDGHLLFHWKYDTRGLLIESISSIPPFKDEMKSQYKYDSLDRLVEKMKIMFGTPLIDKFVYEVNKQGQIIKKTEDKQAWLYSYNEKGNMIEEKWYYLDESLSDKFYLNKFEYNKQNLKTKVTRFHSDNTVFFHKTFEYDDSNNLTKVLRFQNNTITSKWINKYDNQGNLIFEQYFENDILSMWSKTKYDANHLIIEEKGRLNGAPEEYFRKYTYEYYK